MWIFLLLKTTDSFQKFVFAAQQAKRLGRIINFEVEVFTFHGSRQLLVWNWVEAKPYAPWRSNIWWRCSLCRRHSTAFTRRLKSRDCVCYHSTDKGISSSDWYCQCIHQSPIKKHWQLPGRRLTNGCIWVGPGMRKWNYWGVRKYCIRYS